MEIVMEQQNEKSAPNGTTNRARRGSWTMAQKRQVVAESYATGANMADVAQRHGVRPALVSSWRRQVSRMVDSTTKPAKFAAVRVNAPAAAEGVIEIDLVGGCVRVRGIVDARMLREVLAAAR
jgi:transposase-like protein